MTGKIYIIATPIGNLKDITYRAVDTLKIVDLVYCEDTRQSRKLLNAYDISVSLRSLHAHSNDKRVEEACKEVEAGRSIAYITDAGTPGISDPGNRLVREARRRGITIIPLPGPSALATAASMTGFDGKTIIFGGFLSKKPGRRINELEKLKANSGTIIIYESPHRIMKLLNAVGTVFPDQEVVIGREITKIHEEFLSFKGSSLLDENLKITEKGEFVIAINNN